LTFPEGIRGPTQAALTSAYVGPVRFAGPAEPDAPVLRARASAIAIVVEICASIASHRTHEAADRQIDVR
jgi:hypothetical protein